MAGRDFGLRDLNNYNNPFGISLQSVKDRTFSILVGYRFGKTK
jgi:hypothetical protein